MEVTGRKRHHALMGSRRRRKLHVPGGLLAPAPILANRRNSTQTEPPAVMGQLHPSKSKPESAESSESTAPNIGATADVPISSNPSPAAEGIIGLRRGSAGSSSSSTAPNSRVQESSARAKDSSPSSPDDGPKKQRK
ncbi:hypothetical protein F0562_025235 [Nyssa sinensis]|uniref:Uncharacterized protein n=1 Tax=Nyssa sinensis TaxID=561372 RepID=A0A5J5BHP8_9ASTE|nr:hypothetical protein F0562_025235 [Nyssa sinensis]